MVARRVGLVTDITTTSAGDTNGNTFVSTELLDRFPTSLSELWVYEPGNAEARRVVHYDEPEGIAFVNRPFSAQVGGGTQLYIFRRFSPDEFDEALRIAVEECYPYLSQVIVDTSLTTAADTYEYTVPSSIHDLERMYGGKVEIEANTGDADYPYLELRHWDTRRVYGASPSYKLLIHPSELMPGRTLRVFGLAPLTYPATDATTIPLDPPQINLLAYLTLANLYAIQQGAPAGDSNASAGLEAKFRAMYEQKRDEWGITLDPTDLRPPTGGVQRDLPIAYNADPS